MERDPKEYCRECKWTVYRCYHDGPHGRCRSVVGKKRVKDCGKHCPWDKLICPDFKEGDTWCKVHERESGQKQSNKKRKKIACGLM